MRQFAYIGDHESVAPFGIHFPRGVAVFVDDPFVLKKLEGNSHFVERVGDVEIAPEIAPKRRGRPPKARP